MTKHVRHDRGVGKKEGFLLEMNSLIDTFINQETRKFLSVLSAAFICKQEAAGNTEAYQRKERFALIDIVRSWSRGLDVSQIDRNFLKECYSAEYLSVSGMNIVNSVVYVLVESLFKFGAYSNELDWLASNFEKIAEESGAPRKRLRKVLHDDEPLESHIFYQALYKPTQKYYAKTVVTDARSEFVRNTLVSILENCAQGDAQPGTLLYAKHFVKSLGGNEPESVYAYGAKTISLQLSFPRTIDMPTKYLEAYKLAVINFHLRVIRQRNPNNPLPLSEGLTLPYLERHLFSKEWEEGYRAVLPNAFDPVPIWDRWILFPNGDADLSMRAKPNEGVELDFSLLSKPMADLTKAWLWNTEGSVHTKRSKLHSIRRLYTSNDSHIGVTSTSPPRVVLTHSNVLKALATSVGTTNQTKSALKSFVEYGVKTEQLVIEPSALMLLTQLPISHRPPSDIEAISDKDLARVMNRLDILAEESLTYRCIYYATCIVVTSPLRMSEVLDLKITDLEKTPTSGVYKLRRVVKSSGGRKRDIQLSRSAKRALDSVIDITASLREQAPVELCDYIFLFIAKRNSYRVIESHNVNSMLKKAAAECEVKCLPSIIRKTYMTHVVKQGTIRGFDRLDLRPLTNHSDVRVEDIHYLRPDIREYLEATHKITIGNSPIKGDIAISDVSHSKEFLVEGGCGYCRNEGCKIEGTVSCLLCSGFVTTPKHIPEFEEAIKILDVRINVAGSQHDREHLVAVKRLYLHYLGALMTLNSSKENNGY
ncbi:MAG: site-specific integrase [Eggerthellaceae bacterium]|nr:site-specific integrase [Eggerthellaceae bacterium]